MNLHAAGIVDPTASVVTAPLEVIGADLYRDVHKGIRHGLFSLCERAGRLDPANVVGIDAVGADTRWMFALLDAHAAHEDTFIGPELCALDESLDEIIRREHAALDMGMCTIVDLHEAVGRSGGGNQVAARRWYLALASFTSAYLAHEATEELRVSPVLATGLGPDALGELEGRIVASIAPDHFARYLRLILPAINPAERAALVGGIQQAAPPEVFAATMSIASDVLAPEVHGLLVASLG